MPFSVKKGTFTAPAVAGTITVTPGFQIKALIVFGNNQTAEGIAAGQVGSYGLASGTAAGKQRALGWNSDDNVATTDTARMWTDAIIGVPDLAGGTLIRGVLSAIGATTFDINFTTTVSGAIFHYIALGGADLTDADLILYTTPTATGNFDITGTTFTPDVVLFLQSIEVALGSGNVSIVVGWGAAESSSKRWAHTHQASHGQTMTAQMNFLRSQYTTQCVRLVESDTAITLSADFVQFLSNGGRVNFTAVDTVGLLGAALFLRGGQYEVGAVSAPTGAPPLNNDVNVGFPPVGLFLSSYGQIGDNVAARYVDSGQHLGGGDGTDEGTQGSTGKDATLNTQTDRSTVTTKAIRTLTAANPATVDGEADHFFPAGGAPANSFRLTWTDTPAVAAEICYVAFGDAAAAEPDELAAGRRVMFGTLP
jgi:hypothetical protein